MTDIQEKAHTYIVWVHWEDRDRHEAAYQWAQAIYGAERDQVCINQLDEKMSKKFRAGRFVTIRTG